MIHVCCSAMSEQVHVQQPARAQLPWSPEVACRIAHMCMVMEDVPAPDNLTQLRIITLK